MVWIPLQKLDADTSNYLHRVAELGRSTPWGIYIPKATISSWIGIVTGAVTVCGALSLLFLDRGVWMCSPDLPGWLLAAIPLGSLIGTSAWHTRWVRRDSKRFLGEFTFTDPEWHWTVRTHSVEAKNIAGLHGVKAVKSFHDGTYRSTTLSFLVDGGKEELTFTRQSEGGRVARYLMAVEHLSSQNLGPSLQNGMVLGYNAKMTSEPAEPVAVNLTEKEQIPSRTTLKRLSSATVALGSRHGMLQMAAVTLASMLAWFGLPPLGFLWMDESLYSEARAFVVDPTVRHEARIYALRTYLGAVGDEGRHVAEVRDLLDDTIFEAARQDLQAVGVTALRKYLSDSSMTRHRGPAHALIDTEYDRAIASLRKVVISDEEQGLAGLAAGLVDLLTSLKTASSPDVLVTFQSSIQVYPETESEETAEQFVYGIQLSQEKALKAIEQTSRSKSAILDPDRTFSPNQVKQRETIIFERLAEALRKIFRADLVTLVLPGGEHSTGSMPSIEVRYRVHPNGGLYLYTVTTVTTEPWNLHTTSSKKVKGLLRGYTIDWTVVIQPQGLSRPTTHSLSSDPMSSLRMRGNDSDPDWAPNAVIQYSAFYGFSDRLIRVFGLEPLPTPEVFEFKELTSPFETEKEPVTGSRALEGMLRKAGSMLFGLPSSAMRPGRRLARPTLRSSP